MPGERRAMARAPVGIILCLLPTASSLPLQDISISSVTCSVVPCSSQLHVTRLTLQAHAGRERNYVAFLRQASH